MPHFPLPLSSSPPLEPREITTTSPKKRCNHHKDTLTSPKTCKTTKKTPYVSIEQGQHHEATPKPRRVHTAAPQRTGRTARGGRASSGHRGRAGNTRLQNDAEGFPQLPLPRPHPCRTKDRRSIR